MKKWMWLFLCMVTFVSASELEFLHSISEAQLQAKAQEKAILVMFTQQGCPTCEYMKEVAFENELLASYMSSYFILVELDLHHDSYPKELKVFGTPTFYVLNSEGEKIGRQIVGGAEASAFLAVLKKYKQQLKGK